MTLSKHEPEEFYHRIKYTKEELIRKELELQKKNNQFRTFDSTITFRLFSEQQDRLRKIMNKYPERWSSDGEFIRCCIELGLREWWDKPREIEYE